MIRSGALTHLVNQFSALATLTGQAVTDTAAGYGPAIDQALRQLGYSAAGLAAADVSDADTADYLALAEYFALVRFSRALAINVDIEIDGPRAVAKRSQAFTATKELIAESRKQLQDLGYLGAGFEAGYLTLDFLEPSEATA